MAATNTSKKPLTVVKKEELKNEATTPVGSCILVYDQTDGHGGQGGREWGIYSLTAEQYSKWQNYINNPPYCSFDAMTKECTPETPCENRAIDVEWHTFIKSLTRIHKSDPFKGCNTWTATLDRMNGWVQKVIYFSHYWCYLHEQ